jgi:hypothetical protein
MASARLVAALSFEDRATCGAAELADRVGELVMLDYGSRATPGQAARIARERGWEEVVDLAKPQPVRLNRLGINPYSMRDLEDIVLATGPDTHTYVDISCLTRPHVIAVARACAELSAQNRPWSVVYTTPLSYGNIASTSAGFGWRDTLVLPIGREPSASNEGVSLGLVLLGQEAERLQIALDEVEPAAGFAVHIVRHDRPDLYRRTLASNELVLQHLRSLRMPGRRADAIRPMFPSLGWVERGVNLETMLAELSDIVDSVTAAGRAAGAPIFLYPFGPKLGGFAAALMLASRYPEASWCIYPIAVTHPLDYSEGCSDVAVIPASAFTSGVERADTGGWSGPRTGHDRQLRR